MWSCCRLPLRAASRVRAWTPPLDAPFSRRQGFAAAIEVAELCVLAGVSGEVLGTGSIQRVACRAAFRLQPPKAGPKILSAGLRCALRHEPSAERDRLHRGGFQADFGKATGPLERHAFLKYRLPAVACPPPVVLRVTPLLPQSGKPQVRDLTLLAQQVDHCWQQLGCTRPVAHMLACVLLAVFALQEHVASTLLAAPVSRL